MQDANRSNHELSGPKMSEGIQGRILVFIPTFGDRMAIPGLLQEVAGLGSSYRALVVDDGSVPPVRVPAGSALRVRLPANMGLGVSTFVAFAHALRHGYDAVVRVDADGQHRIEDVPRLVAALRDADVVVGVRANHEVPGVTRMGHRLLKRYFAGIAAAMTKGAVSEDANSGCLAVNRRAMEALNATSFERFPEPEILVAAHRARLKISSVPIAQNERAHGKSSIGPGAAFMMFLRFNVFALAELLRRRRP